MSSPEIDQGRVAAFRDELRKLGYVEGKNLRLEQRHAGGYADKLGDLLAELLGANPDVLLVFGAWHIADKLRGKTPVVFVAAADPVGQGLVTNLRRPGGNLTGLSDAHADLVAKRLELIREIAPQTSRVAVLHFPSTTSSIQLQTLRSAGPAQGLSVLPVPLKGPQPAEIDRAFALMLKERAQAVFVIAEPTVSVNRRLIGELARKHRLMTFGTVREWAEDGFLLAYGSNFTEMWRRAASYVDRILKGAKPGDLPVEQPTKFDLVINQRTARAIGLEIPRALLLRADHVIE